MKALALALVKALALVPESAQLRGMWRCSQIQSRRHRGLNLAMHTLAFGWVSDSNLREQMFPRLPGMRRCFPSPIRRHRSLKLTMHSLAFQLLPCLLYTSPSPRDLSTSRMPSSA